MAASLKRSPAGADSATVKFLFSVIKQLETKTVNWQLVANDIGIPNGHAARMRFSRLKAQVEGTAPYGRADKGDGTTPRKKRKMDIRTERKLEAARLAALQAAEQEQAAQGHSAPGYPGGGLDGANDYPPSAGPYIKYEMMEMDGGNHADDAGHGIRGKGCAGHTRADVPCAGPALMAVDDSMIRYIKKEPGLDGDIEMG